MAAKKAKKQEETGVLKVTAPRIGFVEVTVGNKGLGSTLITHAMGEKFKHYLKMRGQNMLGGRKQAKEKRDPEREYKESMYYMPGSTWKSKNPKYGLMAAGFKKGMVRAAKPIDGIAMTDVLGTIFVHEEADGLVPIECKPPRQREDIVNIGKGNDKTPDLRWRGEFTEWSTKLRIQYDADFFAGEEVLNLLARAGLTVGWGEMRLEKGYTHGQYVIQGKPKITEPNAA